MTTINSPLNRPLRMALIGGAGQAFIGPVHATAAMLDRRAELVAGALSSDAQRGRAAAARFGIEPDRAYASADELIAAERALPDDRRIDFVSIATPNDTHFEIAQAALRAGFHVVCDKPMTISTAQAEQLVQLVESQRRVFVLTHNYSGYPMVRQAREMIAAGELGRIEAFRAHYLQGWMRSLVPGTTPARGAWKSDPQRNGPSGSLGDIGTHAYQLARFVTQAVPAQICCNVRTFQPGSKLDDYGHVLLQLDGGGIGMITYSQVTHGRLNDLAIEVDGTDGSLSWRQEEPNQLLVRRVGQPLQVYDRSPTAQYTHGPAAASCRLPAGHPEGFFEAFANLYRDGFDDMIQAARGMEFSTRATKYPNVHDGLEGVRFIEQCLASSQQSSAWMPLLQWA